MMLRPCPKCGEPGGMGYCPVCHGAKAREAAARRMRIQAPGPVARKGLWGRGVPVDLEDRPAPAGQHRPARLVGRQDPPVQDRLPGLGLPSDLYRH
jgi:hypothetical protein